MRQTRASHGDQKPGPDGPVSVMYMYEAAQPPGFSLAPGVGF